MATNNVTVNLNIGTDASGSIEVFGQAPVTLSNQIVALSASLKAADISGCLEFWEPSDALGTLKARRRVAWGEGEKTTFASNLGSVFSAGVMDASDAEPFKTGNSGAYLTAPTDKYYKYTSFGDVALASMAHYLFGHVAATAAITNDTAFVSSINGASAGQSQIAVKLADKLFSLSDADALAIVNQVIGQDASRARDQDNNQLAPDAQQSLVFKAGDVIFVQVTLLQPTVTVSGTATDVNAQQGEPAASAVTPQTYNVRITLA